MEEGIAEGHRSLSYEKMALSNLSSAFLAKTHHQGTHCHCGKERPNILQYHMSPLLQQD